MKKKIFIGILMISVIMVLVIGFVCIYFDSIQIGVYYSEQPGCYGHNGIYSSQEYDAIFIYWADEPLGNVIDGYV